jgi:hypothetical protein
MDAITFDTLIKRLATRRLTRVQTLRGLAAGGVAALTGVSLLGEEGEAENKKPSKKKWCHRGDDFTILGITKKFTKDQRKKHKRRHAADYRGQCTAANIISPTGTLTGTPLPTTTVAPGPGPECTSNADCADRRACLSGTCSSCTHFSQCADGEACLEGRCIGTVTCSSDADCDPLSPLLDCEQAAGPNPLVCLLLGQCPPAAMGVACAGAEEFCVLGECVVTCSGADPCTGPGKQCIHGLCIQAP